MGCVLLTACSSNEDEEVRSRDRVALNVMAGGRITAFAETRAYDDQWEAGDKIGLFITTSNTSPFNIYTDEPGTRCSNLKYVFDDASFDTEDGTVFRAFKGRPEPDDDPEAQDINVYLPTSNIYVYAYYPYRYQDNNGDDIDDLNPRTIPIDLSDQTDQNAIDFLRTPDPAACKKESNKAQLLFNHALVKVRFNLKAGKDMMDEEIGRTAYTNNRLKVGIGSMKDNGTINVYTGNITTSEDLSTIYAVPMAEDAPAGYVITFEAIVFPIAEPHLVTVTIGTTANTFSICTGLDDDGDPETHDRDVSAFVSGHIYTYNVTLNATSIRVERDHSKYTEQW